MQQENCLYDQQQYNQQVVSIKHLIHRLYQINSSVNLIELKRTVVILKQSIKLHMEYFEHVESISHTCFQLID